MIKIIEIDIACDLSIPESILIKNLSSKQSFDDVLINLDQVLGHFGLFWGILKSQKISKFTFTGNLVNPADFFPLK